jgi:S1-C subfamily serine protease
MFVKPKCFHLIAAWSKKIFRNKGILLAALFVSQVSSAGAQNMLAALERDMRQLVEAAKPSVVTIMAATAAQKSEGGGLFGLFRGKDSNPPEVKVGSGLIVSSDGFIVTKESVVRGANQIETTLSNGQILRAEMVALDSASGIAVLKIAGEKFSPAPVGGAESGQAGSWVTVIGNAFGMPHAVSVGVMSAIHASGVLQISANVDPGSSGSPVFNTQGHAVGIVSGRMGLGPQNVMPENYFSCTALVYPLASYLPRLREIVRGYYESRGWLGVTVMADAKDRRYLRVLSLVKDGPAEHAGIQVGDVITHFTNKPVDASTNLPAMVAACKPGSKEALKVVRGDSLYSFNVQIGQQIPIALNELQPVRDEAVSDIENRTGKTPATEVELKKIENFQIHQRIRALEKELKYLRSLQQKQ